ncbi:unnamed protein product [Urochloa decumbens]|uniref:Cyclin n=1 Tax=Urochloa decumbens TaxID=240449 RepID=A0ABC9F8H1_9POAL
MTAVALPTDAAAGEHTPSSSSLPETAAPPSTWPPPPPPELAMVARAVQRLVARNDAVVAPPDGSGGAGGMGMRAFEAAREPRIGVAEYLERMHRYAGLDPECYVVAYAYVDMAAHRRPAAAVASRNVHRLLLACLLVASKVLDDFHHSNAFFARVGGVSNAEMNRLELELLGVLDFAVAVDHRTYARYREHLEKEMRRDTLPRAAPKPPPTRTAAAHTAVANKPLPSPVKFAGGNRREERDRRKPVPAGVPASEEHGRKLPNGAPAVAGLPSLRELWAVDY